MNKSLFSGNELRAALRRYHLADGRWPDEVPACTRALDLTYWTRGHQHDYAQRHIPVRLCNVRPSPGSGRPRPAGPQDLVGPPLLSLRTAASPACQHQAPLAQACSIA